MKRTLFALAVALACNWAFAAVPVAACDPHDGAAPPNATTTLYSQNGRDSGVNFVSQAFDSCLDTYDSAAADDFVVPKGQVWDVSQVEVTGTYFNGTGPADSVTLTFYSDANGLPGALLATRDRLPGNYRSGSFAIKIPAKVELQGHVWVSVQVNMYFPVGGEWGWESQTAVVGKPAVWQNPGGGFGMGCTTWTPEGQCFANSAGDQMFKIKGKARNTAL